jgi:hypothetical protein
MSAYYEIVEHVVFHAIAEHFSGGNHRRDDAAPGRLRLDAPRSASEPLADPFVGRRGARLGLD